MADIRLFGPATITHDGTDIGKTSGGIELSFLKHTIVPIRNDFYKVEEKVYGVEGSISKFKLSSAITISGDNVLYDYGELIFTLPDATITLYKAKLALGDSLSFGQNQQEVFPVKIFGGENTSGNVITIE